MGSSGEEADLTVPVVITLPSSAVASRLASLAASFAMADTMEELAISAQEAIEAFIGVEYNGLYLWDQEARGLRLLYSIGFSEEERIEAERTAIDRHPGQVFRSGEVLHVRDAAANPKGSESSRRSFSVRSRLFVPVTFRDETHGVFGLASPIPDRFSDEDIALVRFICRLAGVVYRRILDRLEHESRQLEAQRSLALANAELVAAQAELVAANTALEARVAARTRDLETNNASLKKALAQVKRSQEQMIQGEKMASLGLLVAGIAHEIKNPLNFVINFADLSLELVGELTELLASTEPDTDELQALLVEIVNNLRRISEHGERANQTTNAMLMHARDRSGEPVDCDLNSLVREHATLAYKALRVLDSSFIVDFDTDFDPTLTNVRLPFQEVSRVLVNLVNNACHALQARSQTARGAFSPKIRLCTRRSDGAARITIHDNGTGISKEIQSRIFDPFFTTKKPGEGTGLGLSIAYDIIVKQLGGHLMVNSTPGESTTFTVEIPLAPAPAEVESAR